MVLFFAPSYNSLSSFPLAEDRVCRSPNSTTAQLFFQSEVEERGNDFRSDGKRPRTDETRDEADEMKGICRSGSCVVREKVNECSQAELVALKRNLLAFLDCRKKEKNQFTSSHPFRPIRLTMTSMMLTAKLKSGFSFTSSQRQCKAAGASGVFSVREIGVHLVLVTRKV